MWVLFIFYFDDSVSKHDKFSIYEEAKWAPVTIHHWVEPTFCALEHTETILRYCAVTKNFYLENIERKSLFNRFGKAFASTRFMCRKLPQQERTQGYIWENPYSYQLIILRVEFYFFGALHIHVHNEEACGLHYLKKLQSNHNEKMTDTTLSTNLK